jgi:predicted Zn-dependent protease
MSIIDFLKSNVLTSRFVTKPQILFVCLLFLLSANFVAAQTPVFQPMDTFGADDKPLLYQLNMQTKEEIDRTESSKKAEINRAYKEIGKRLVSLVYTNEFIKNNSLQAVLDGIVKKLVESNQLKFPPKLILIQNSAMVNAVSSADGTLIVYIGLISKAKNESQLAFVMAHEIAHFELQHIRKRITKTMEEELVKKHTQNIRGLASENASEENMKNLKQIWYYLGANSRQGEFQADSLALQMMVNSGFDRHQAIPMLAILDQSTLAAIDMEFMWQLDLTNYPLRDEWFKKRPSLFSKERGDAFMSNDSLNTHPDLDLRKQALMAKLGKSTGHDEVSRNKEFNNMIVVASYQSVESAFKNEQFDLCLYLALKLRTRFPYDPYLTSMIAKVLTGLCERKNFDYDFNLALPQYTMGYNEELRAINEFLHNLNREELGDLAYYFLYDKKNFDVACEKHYYLLWKISSILDNSSERKRIKSEYSDRFEEQQYKGKMTSYSPYRSKLSKKKSPF